MGKRQKRGAERALRLEWIEVGSLESNPTNWRRHGEIQMGALRELLDDPHVGWAGALLYNERTGHLIDGHARRDAVDPGSLVPVLVGRWSEEAERKILLSLDPLAAMADCDGFALTELIHEVEFDTPALTTLANQLVEELPEIGLASQARGNGTGPLRSRHVNPPPARTWVLIGIATVRYGEIADTVERIASKRDVFCEVVANDD